MSAEKILLRRHRFAETILLWDNNESARAILEFPDQDCPVIFPKTKINNMKKYKNKEIRQVNLKANQRRTFSQYGQQQIQYQEK